MGKHSIQPPPDLTQPPPGDFICPVPTCRATCAFSAQARCVTCRVCGLVLHLTAEQTAELVDAVLGISELHIPAYLLHLHLTDGGPQPPPTLRYPPARPVSLFLDRVPSLVAGVL